MSDFVPGGCRLLAALPAAGSESALATFLGYTAIVLTLAWLSNRVLAGRPFLSEYYLGSRSLGVIALTLTIGATSASAGSFGGFPALIYTHGWSLAVWIAGYMVVPICVIGLLGKRLNQVARKSGAITLPDILRDRFNSPGLALVSTLLMAVMLGFYLVPQFKVAAIILEQLFEQSTWFHWTSSQLGTFTSGLPVVGSADLEYLLCLLLFGAMVVVYTAIGGFRAVVWTDVLQGGIMLGGVLTLLILALHRVGGLGAATEKLAEMTPPRIGTAVFAVNQPTGADIRIPRDRWLFDPSEDGAEPRLLRTNEVALIAAGRTRSNVVKLVEITTPQEIANLTSSWDNGAPPPLPRGVALHDLDLSEYAFGANQPGVYVRLPGPSPGVARGFLALGTAISFFVFWPLAGAGQPGTMVRLMAFDSSRTLRGSIAALTVYFGIIYFPLVIIFCCARIIVPGLDQTPDRIMPVLCFNLAAGAGVPWLAGLLVAAPFAAAMSTVDSFMLMISSSVVRDVYQRSIHPTASERTVKRLSYACILIVGAIVTLGAVNPPKFLQDLVVFTGGGLAVAFLVPIVFVLYWPRANTTGTIASMLGGFTFYSSLYIGGRITFGSLKPWQPLQLDPVIWGILSSVVIGVLVTLRTEPPRDDLVRTYFHVR